MKMNAMRERSMMPLSIIKNHDAENRCSSPGFSNIAITLVISPLLPSFDEC